MRLLIKPTALLLSLFVCSISSYADDIQSPVKPELIANVANFKPGDSFTLGVLFKIQKGWHIYWKNPGDSGLPVSVKFTLPEGFTVSELSWPVPVSFKRSGGAVDYGYENSVLLLAKVKAPSQLNDNLPIPIEANLSWISCQEVCLPGKGKVELKLPVSNSASPANTELFEKWQKRVPVDVDSAGSPFVSKITGSFNEIGKPQNFTVTLDWKTVPVNIDWFPAPTGALNIDNVDVKTQGRQTVINFTAKVYAGQKLPSSHLETVVAYTDSNGERRGISLPLRLQPKNNL